MSRSPVRVVAISDDALRSKLLDTLVDDETAHRVIFVEPLSRAYSRIRQLIPNLFVIFMRIDDERGCRLLTMLETDRELDHIPVVTWATGENDDEIGHGIAGAISVHCCASATA
jgi:DNA-binding NtrC family response regulator